jgi:hypothetical protein
MITLDGYDFSGWQINITGANGRIINSLIRGDTNIWGQAQSSNLYIGYCEIDGQNVQQHSLITMNGVGLTVEHSWLHNSGGDAVQLQSPGGGQLVLRYNLIEQVGQLPGSHGDFLQIFTGAPFTASILFNTTRQATGFTQGFMLNSDGPWGNGVLMSGDIGYNTMVNTGGSAQYYFTGATVAAIVRTVTVHDNYFAGAGLAHPASGFGPNDASTKTIFTNNVNTATGAVVQDASPARRMLSP